MTQGLWRFCVRRDFLRSALTIKTVNTENFTQKIWELVQVLLWACIFKKKKQKKTCTSWLCKIWWPLNTYINSRLSWERTRRWKWFGKENFQSTSKQGFCTFPRFRASLYYDAYRKFFINEFWMYINHKYEKENVGIKLHLITSNWWAVCDGASVNDGNAHLTEWSP